MATIDELFQTLKDKLDLERKAKDEGLAGVKAASDAIGPLQDNVAASQVKLGSDQANLQIGQAALDAAHANADQLNAAATTGVNDALKVLEDSVKDILTTS